MDQKIVRPVSDTTEMSDFGFALLEGMRQTCDIRAKYRLQTQEFAY